MITIPSDITALGHAAEEIYSRMRSSIYVHKNVIRIDASAFDLQE